MATSESPSTFLDFQGTPISRGAAVASTGYGFGTPKGADHGVVVGFGRTRVRVRWDGYAYDSDVPYHTSRPGQLRVLQNPIKQVPTGTKREYPKPLSDRELAVLEAEEVLAQSLQAVQGKMHHFGHEAVDFDTKRDDAIAKAAAEARDFEAWEEEFLQ